MKKILFVFLLLLSIEFTACGMKNSGVSEETTEITIAAAASLTDVTADLAEKFMAKNKDITINFTYGGSGALQTQIEEGAPVDIFMSASNKQMDALQKKGLILAGSQVDLLENEIVLIKPIGSTLDIDSFEDCTSEMVNIIGVGDFASVPIGEYTEEIFTNLGLLEQVSPKFNFATDVRQILTWVETAEVDCGVVYATDAALSDKVEVICNAPEGSHSPVIYPAAIMKRTTELEACQKFMGFLASDEAEMIISSYGFV